jgi:FkbM family methyltransferase
MNYKSQYGQDKWIIENIFKGMTHGYFIDIGAGDGEILSNTWVMEKEFNWSGICIDPCNVTWEKLKKNRNCKTDNVLVSNYDGEQDFYEVTREGYYVSYFSGIKIPKGYPEPECTKINKKCEKLYTTLDRLNSSTLIHYLSIDTEGMEYDILKKFFEDEYRIDKRPWKRRIISMSIEHNSNAEYRQRIRTLLTENLYTYVTSLGEDDIYVHQLYEVLCQ